MNVARRDSIKKNNKLSNVDKAIIINSQETIFPQKRILKKNQPFVDFFFQINELKSFF